MNSVEETTEPEVVVSTSKPAPVEKQKRQPRYAVIVLNDDVHTFDYVILALAKVFGYSVERGFQPLIARTGVGNGHGLSQKPRYGRKGQLSHDKSSISNALVPRNVNPILNLTPALILK